VVRTSRREVVFGEMGGSFLPPLRVVFFGVRLVFFGCLFRRVLMEERKRREVVSWCRQGLRSRGHKTEPDVCSSSQNESRFPYSRSHRDHLEEIHSGVSSPKTTHPVNLVLTSSSSSSRYWVPPVRVYRSPPWQPASKRLVRVRRRRFSHPIPGPGSRWAKVQSRCFRRASRTTGKGRRG